MYFSSCAHGDLSRQARVSHAVGRLQQQDVFNIMFHAVAPDLKLSFMSDAGSEPRLMGEGRTL